MKLTSLSYLAIALAAAPLVSSSQIIDADFEAADGAAWTTDFGFGTGAFNFTFPASGGNPGGHAVMDSTDYVGGFGVLVTNSGDAILLSDLGLTAGESYLFTQDMKIFEGPNLGGFKIDFFEDVSNNMPDADTADIYPSLIGDGSTWETYEFQITIPETAVAVKIVPLWGPESSVGYDNITFSTDPIVIGEITEIPNSSFDQGATKWAGFGFSHTSFSYPTTGGNPGAHAVMTNDDVFFPDDDDFGVIISNGGTAIPLEGLGLTAGETYVFQQDMKLLSGSDIGGIKVEFEGTIPFSPAEDIRVPLIGDGSTWETYSYQIAIPSEATALQVVPIWGRESSVAFDNITFLPTPILTPPVQNFDFEAGGANWAFFAQSDQATPTTLDYPATGGNPGGYAEISNTSGWAVLVSNNAAIIPIEEFGITEQGTFEFQMDMRIFSGSSLGALKVEYYDASGSLTGDTGDLFPQMIGDGSTWETYTFDVFIGSSTAGLKVVPVAGNGSTVGFDNIATPSQLDGTFAGWISDFPGVGSQDGFNDDPDGDGQPNGIENFFGTDPSLSTEGFSAMRFTTNVPIFIVSHPQNPDPVPASTNVIYKWSTDLENFYLTGETNPGGTSVNLEVNQNNPVEGTTSVEAVSSGTTPERVFIRVEIAPAP